MLKYFLAMEVDEKGKELEQNSNRPLFNNFKIASTDIINEQGKHPVIFITLKTVQGPSYQSLENQLRSVISDLFLEYKYLTNSMEEEIDSTKFKQILNRTSSPEDLTNSIQFLSKLIYKYHHKQPYVLIDEYDVPLNNSYNTDYYQEVLSLIRRLFGSGIKDNSYIEKAVVTGVFKIAKSGLWTGMNNSKDYSILSDKYAQYFGFTESEVEALLIEANIQDELIKSAVRQWYNGYTIGGFTIYNPWSIVNFFSDLKFGPYWINTESMVAGDRRLSTDLMITEQVHDKINLLITNFGKELTELTINPEVVFSTINQEASSLFSLLLFGGYLSVESSYNDEMGFLVCQARIPNKEILRLYKSSISLWVKDKLAIDKKSFDSLSKDFNLEDIVSVKNVIDEAISIYGDRIAQKNENIFHGLIQSICLLKGDKHRIASESYSGAGRIDSIFYPIKGKSDTVIIHEYKIIKEATEENLVVTLRRAMWQVYNKIYTSKALFKKDFFKDEFNNFEIRAIIIICDENKANVQIIRKLHTVNEMRAIASDFSLDGSNATIEKIADDINNEIADLLRKRQMRNKLQGEI